MSKLDKNDGQLKLSKQPKLPPDKIVNNKLNNQNKTSVVKLDYNLLNFTPICDVTGKEAVSAVTRAKSQICKEIIVNVTCMGLQGKLYPKRLHSSCPHSMGFNGSPKKIGCYQDDKTQRMLTGFYTVLKSNNSPEQCALTCLQYGYPYAGTEYSVECFCGVEEPSQTKRLSDSSCNMKCSGDPRQSCGGYLAINIFKTGIQSNFLFVKLAC